MTRHLLDHSLATSRGTPVDHAPRTRAFLRIARGARENPVWKALRRAPRLEKAQPLHEALRIARGQTT